MFPVEQPVPSVCHGNDGTSLVVSGSLFCAGEVDWHVPHFFTVLWICSVIPGQKIDSLVQSTQSTYFSIPW